MKYTLPNGKVLTGVPDGTPEYAILEKAARNGWYDPGEEVGAPPDKEPKGLMAHLQAAIERADTRTDAEYAQRFQQRAADRRRSVVHGMGDLIHGGAQLTREGAGAVERATGLPVQSGPDRLNEWLRSQGVPLAPVPTTETLAAREAAYQAGRMRPGEFDIARLGGNVMGTAAMLPLVGLGSEALTFGALAGNIGRGAAIGGTGAALFPVTQGEFWPEKGTQAGLGAAVGATLPVAAGGIARALSPRAAAPTQEIAQGITRENPVQTLMAAGVRPTPGQILGGAFKTTEEKLASLPVVGDAIRTGTRRAYEEMNRGLYNHILGRIGTKLPKGLDAGHTAFDFTHSTLSKAYDDLLPQMRGRMDSQLATELSTIRNMVGTLPKRYRDQFQRFLEDKVLHHFNSGGAVSGRTVKDIQIRVRQSAEPLQRADDFDKQKLGEAASEVQEALYRMLERHNPADKVAELRNINAGWAEHLVLEKAVGGSKGGVFTPAKLRQSVKALDPSKGRRLTAAGRARLQGYADAAEEVLGPTVPNSGTFDRTVTALTLGGAGYVDPWLLAGVASSAAPWTRPGQNLIARILAQRGPWAEPTAQALRTYAPGSAVAFAPFVGAPDGSN